MDHAVSEELHVLTSLPHRVDELIARGAAGAAHALARDLPALEHALLE